MGLPGRVRQYRCDKCGGIIITREVDDGLTIARPPCYATEGCDGAMRGLAQAPQQTAVTHVWFKPKSLAGIPDRWVDHVAAGGLLLEPFHTWRMRREAA